MKRPSQDLKICHETWGKKCSTRTSEFIGQRNVVSSGNDPVLQTGLFHEDFAVSDDKSGNSFNKTFNNLVGQAMSHKNLTNTESNFNRGESREDPKNHLRNSKFMINKSPWGSRLNTPEKEAKHYIKDNLENTEAILSTRILREY